MIETLPYIAYGIVFGRNQRSIKVITGQIPMSLELLEFCTQRKDSESRNSEKIAIMRNIVRVIIFGHH